MIIEAPFLGHFFIYDFLEWTKIASDGCLELVPKRSWGEGTCLLKPAGKSLIVSVTNLMCRRPVEYIARDRREYFYIGFCRGTMRGIIGAHIEKDKMYRQQCPSGFTHCGVGVSFLPEFCDAFLSSRHGVSSEEIARAVDALRAVPLIPDAAVILKQIGEISCTGDIGNVWIEAKTLELVAAVLDWHRRSAAAPALNKHDRAGISEAICYIEEYFSGPLTLTALAKQAAMSVSKFTAAFKIHTGISAACYVRRFRMEKAMHLLKNTPAPLRDIAGMVGYKHHSRFSTLFKEQFGIAPGEFRLNLRFSHSKALR